MSGGHFMFIRSHEAVAAEARDVLGQLEAKARAAGNRDPVLIDFHELDPTLFAQFIHCLTTLGAVGGQQLAGLAAPHIKLIDEII